MYPKGYKKVPNMKTIQGFNRSIFIWKYPKEDYFALKIHYYSQSDLKYLKMKILKFVGILQNLCA